MGSNSKLGLLCKSNFNFKIGRDATVSIELNDSGGNGYGRGDGDVRYWWC